MKYCFVIIYYCSGETETNSMDVLEKFLAANSKSEIFALLTEQCGRLGFDYCVYSPLVGGRNAEKVFKDGAQPLAGDSLVEQNTFVDCPAPWLQRYQEAGHAIKDPVMKHVSRSTLPVFWDDANRTEPGNIVFGEAREHGLAHGITVSVSVPGGERSLLSLSASGRARDADAHRLTVAGLAQLTIHYVHESVRVVENKLYEGSLPTLTTREKDCLQWAAIGKTSWEMAQILHISERTAVFHVTNAARKLGAVNRRQAVVRALNLRLISP